MEIKTREGGVPVLDWQLDFAEPDVRSGLCLEYRAAVRVVLCGHVLQRFHERKKEGVA